MKICVTSSGPTLQAELDPRFGRCAHFLFVDPETLEVEAVANPNAQESGGAGILSAQFVVNRNAGGVVTGRVGPNAERVLRAAGVEVVTVSGGTAREAVEAFKSRAAGEPEVESPAGQVVGRGLGRGRGRGRGRGAPGSHGPHGRANL